MSTTPTPTSTGTGVVTVQGLAGRIGARVDGIDLALPLDAEVVTQLRTALLQHGVLFFRGQRLTHEQHIALGERFGVLTARARPQDGTSLDAYPQILTVSTQADLQVFRRDAEAHYRTRWATPWSGWHCDVSHSGDPTSGLDPAAETVPPYGGDTHWTNLVAAYHGLSDPLRRFVDGLHAEHTFFAGYEMDRTDPFDLRLIETVSANPMAAIHPLVRIHPETHERALFVSPSRMARIVESTPAESRAVLALLCEHITQAEYTTRWQWAAGDVAFWDNRATAHIAATDVPTGMERTLYRVTLAGDRPVGPHGSVSRLVSGRPPQAVPAPA
jgi:alpha-ketoglutarate-dependent taurine dioxygenase